MKRIVKDGTAVSTGDVYEFRDLLSRFDSDEAGWEQISVKDLCFRIASENFYDFDGSMNEAVMNTIENTNMCFRVGDRHYLVRDIALASIEKRVGLAGSALPELQKADLPDFCAFLNKCAEIYGGDSPALIRYSAGKCSAVLSGDYVPMSQRALFDAAENCVKSIRFMNGYVSNAITIAEMCIDDRKLAEEYIRRLGDAADIRMEGIFQTSDIGESAATFATRIQWKDHQGWWHKLPLGGNIYQEHKGKDASPAVFARELTPVMMLYSEALKQLDALEKVRIVHPRECFGHIVSKIGIPKKYAAQAWESLELTVPDMAHLTARELYLGLCEVLYFMEIDSKKLPDVVAMEDNLKKVIFLDFPKYDTVIP